MSTTVVHDSSYSPKVTLTKDDGGGFTAIIEVEGLEPNREPSAEEQGVGISSLNPPTVSVSAEILAVDTWRKLIAVAQRATSTAITSTLGVDPTPGELIMVYFRVALGVRSALRLLGEEI